MPFWHRLVIAAAVFLVVTLLARFIDWWLVRRPLPAEAATRYRVLRRTISVANEKLASDTIRNSTIRSRETFAEITVPVPLATDLGAAVDGLREEVAAERDASVYVSALEANATLTIRAAAPTEDAAQKLERDLRVR